MKKSSISKELEKFRVQIDDIDQKIIDLLSARMKVVAAVGKHKEKSQDKCFIRSNREADMIKDLIKKSDKKIPASTIASIWRKIITSANVLEQGIKIAVHNPKKLPYYHYLIKEYYADFVPVVDYSSSTNVILEIEKKNMQIGVFCLPSKTDVNEDLDHWWINMANSNNGLKVFAKIPLIEYEKDQNMIHTNLVAVAIKDAERSQNDKTLLTIELESQFPVSNLQKLLKDSDLEAKVLKTAKIKEVRNINFYLVEVDGFYEQDGKEIKDLLSSTTKPHVKVIGHYATPIIIS